MNTKISLFLVLSFIALNQSLAQKQVSLKTETLNNASLTVNNSPIQDFTTLWKQVDSLAQIGQPRSALEIVNKIYMKSKTEKNDPQMIKSIIYRIRLNSDFQENFLLSTITDLQKEIQTAGQPARQMLQSILAEVYWKYYQNNQYRFRDRTKIAANIPDSIDTWDLSTIFRKITRCYMFSLENADSLKRIQLEKYNAIIDKEAFESKKRESLAAEAFKYIPTLYDFLAGRALDFFSSDPASHLIPAQHFEVDLFWYFGQAFFFANNRMLIPADSSAPASFALRIFRDLATFHMSDKDPRAFIDNELKRLAFVYKEFSLPGKDSLYLGALKQFEQAQINSPWGTSISYALADYFNTRGQLYKPLVSDLHKWDFRSALETCDKAIQRFPDSEGAKNCKTLARSIKEFILRVTTESAVPVEKPSLALVEFKNIKQCFFRLVKTDPEVYAEKADILDQKDYIKFLTSLPSTRSWSLNLPNDGDFQQHALEIGIPEVPMGFWVLLCATSKEFNDPKQVFAYAPFWSTQISYISKNNEDGSLGYYLLDRETGLPLKNVKVEAWEKSYNYRERQYTTTKLHDYASDGQGFFLIPPSEDTRRNANLYLKLRNKNDFFITDNFYQHAVYTGQPQISLQTMFYTDRAIYRPGQIVYFKGIILERTGDRSKIKTKQKTNVIFTDANGQKIGEQSFNTNEFGSFNGSFTAPKGVMPGQMTISNESGSVYISVEEYKRPTFDVVCDPLEGNYRLGETIKVTGKASAYAGSAIDGAMLKYRVVRSASFPFWDWGWRRPMPASPQLEITNGITSTNPAGTFSFEFTAIPDLSMDKETKPVFDYTIYIDVTDLNGETQSLQQSVSVGYNSLLIELNMTDMVNLAKDSAIKFRTTNLNGRSTPSLVTFTLYKLRQPDRIFKPRLWAPPDTTMMTREEFYSKFPNNIFGNENEPGSWEKEKILFEEKISTQMDSILKINNPINGIRVPGSYLLAVKTIDPFGEVVEKKQFFTAFSPNSREVPVNALNWFVPLKTTGEPGENTRFLIGSKDENVHMIYEIRCHDSLVSREVIKLNDRAQVLEVPIIEQYRGNFAVNFVFVKHNRVFQNSQLIEVPYTNKKLDIAFETFRDKIEPGAKERWKIRITRAGGKPANAEFLATMYDASLDIFRANSWIFNIYTRYSGINPWNVSNTFRISTGQWFSTNPGNDTYSFHPGLQLNWFGLNYFGGSGRHLRYSRGTLDKSTGAMMMDMPANAVAETNEMIPPEMNQESAKAVTTDKAGITEKAEKNKQGTTKPSEGEAFQVRRDFRETAFFYPSMLTDSTGSLILQFTAPESLTKWKLLGLTYTKSLDYGLVEKSIFTRKELMVFPNAPRFVRQGDTVIFSAKVVNLADHDLSGVVTLKLSDALTLQSYNNLIDTTWNYTSRGDQQDSVKRVPEKGTRQQTFTIKRDQSAVVSWKLLIPAGSGLSVLQYQIGAIAGNFSDGEEKAIPVLTNRMLVTESLPLPVRVKGTVEFSFEKLLNSASSDQQIETMKSYRLTLEFASNPAWYAIQALPLLNQKKFENADAIFTAFWSNSLAAFIANSNPKIKAVFESWKELTPDALKSNLEKNQELKSALLKETPWVLEAASETERKQKLGLYFDLNNIEANLRENLNMLKKLQTQNGGWTWFAGMPENRWITQMIISGMGHLDQLGVTSVRKDPETWNMVLRGIQFLDQELIKDFENQKKYDSGYRNHNHLSSAQIQYLYARSYFMNNPRTQITDPGVKFRESFDYYKEQAARYWLQNDRHLQGMIAIALSRLGNIEVPGLILKSLKEKALHSDEMGMYWAGEPGFYWHQTPIETQALMIELFDEVARDEASVEELKIWLLKQKQTQDWRSPKATLEACYALLLRGTDLLSEEPGVKISIGKEKINSEKLIDKEKEAGTGYFQVSWSGNQIKPEMGKVTIAKSTQGIAWGALYWQYFENLDKITPASTPMKLEKKLFVERNTTSGPELEPLMRSENKPGSPDQLYTSSLKLGDKLKVRIILTVDRDLEFVHLKDLRASTFEPYLVAKAGPESGTRYPVSSGDGLSGYHYQDGLGYYQSTTDQATNFFFDYLPKGTYVFEYALKVNAAGEYSNGITSVQCMYAPEFSSHSEGVRVKIDFL